MLCSISSRLHETLSHFFALHTSRLQVFVDFVLGIHQSRTVNQVYLSTHLSGSAEAASKYRRGQRFFREAEISQEQSARALTQLLAIKGHFVLCLDRTNWKFGKTDINILVLAVCLRRVSFPLFWTFLKGKGNSSERQRIVLMERFLSVFGHQCIKVLLADREFIGKQWFSWLCRHDIPFVIRVKRDLTVNYHNGAGKAKIQSLCPWVNKSKKTKFLKNISFPGMEMEIGLTLVGKRNDDDPLFLLTNSCPETACSLYKQRWRIECMFAHAKTNGFNIEDTHMTDHKKLSLMVMIVAFAMVCVALTMRAIMGRSSIPKASHGRRRLSWFKLGLVNFRNWISSGATNQKANKFLFYISIPQNS